jgi:hypothetical protein
VTISGYLWLLLVWLHLMVDYVGTGLAAFTWRQMQYRTNLIKFAQTAAGDQLVMRRLNQNAEVTQ